MSSTKIGIVSAGLIITFGICGLLNNLNFLDPVDWFWVGGLAVTGKMLFYLSGLNKVSFVLGPFLLFASLLSIFHQLDMLPWSIMLPLLIIVFGGLLLGAFILRLKMPESLQIADRDDP